MSTSGAQQADGAFTVGSRRLQEDEKEVLSAAGYVGEGVLVALTGELDLASAAAAEQELVRAESSHALVVLDLRGLTFIDSTGLRLIIAGEHRARERGAAFVVADPVPQVRRLLDLSGIASHLEVIEGLDQGGNPER